MAGDVAEDGKGQWSLNSVLCFNPIDKPAERLQTDVFALVVPVPCRMGDTRQSSSKVDVSVRERRGKGEERRPTPKYASQPSQPSSFIFDVCGRV